MLPFGMLRSLHLLVLLYPHPKLPQAAEKSTFLTFLISLLESHLTQAFYWPPCLKVKLLSLTFCVPSHVLFSFSLAFNNMKYVKYFAYLFYLLSVWTIRVKALWGQGFFSALSLVYLHTLEKCLAWQNSQVSVYCTWSGSCFKVIWVQREGDEMRMQMRQKWQWADCHWSRVLGSGGFMTFFSLQLHKPPNKHIKPNFIISFIPQFSPFLTC